MRFLFAVIVVFGLLLFSRTFTGQQFFGSLLNLVRFGSGSVQAVEQGVRDAVNMGKTGVEKIGEGVQNIQERSGEIRQGLQTLASGSQLIEQGFKQVTGK